LIKIVNKNKSNCFWYKIIDFKEALPFYNEIRPLEEIKEDIPFYN
jgi:hypothetical protein